jgi:hypothetical protein
MLLNGLPWCAKSSGDGNQGDGDCCNTCLGQALDKTRHQHHHQYHAKQTERNCYSNVWFGRLLLLPNGRLLLLLLLLWLLLLLLLLRLLLLRQRLLLMPNDRLLLLLLLLLRLLLLVRLLLRLDSLRWSLGASNTRCHRSFCLHVNTTQLTMGLQVARTFCSSQLNGDANLMAPGSTYACAGCM